MTETRIVRLEGGPYHGHIREVDGRELRVWAGAGPGAVREGRYVPCPTKPDDIWRWDTRFGGEHPLPLELKVPEDPIEAEDSPDVITGHYFGMEVMVLGHKAFERELFRLQRELVARGMRPGDPAACVRYTVDFKL